MGQKLTEFGMMVRQLRLSRGRTMADQARALKCTPSHISQVETGKIPVPASYVKDTADWFGLDEKTERALQEAADRHRKTVRINPLDEGRAQLASDFARAINHLPEETLHQLRIIIDEAHTRKFSDEQIEELALALRKLLGIDDRVFFDALKIVEVIITQAEPRFLLTVNDRMQTRMGKVRGRSRGYNAELAEDVYIQASNNNPGARKTLLHEFAHFLLHRSQMRLKDGGKHSIRHQVFERQAKLFVRRFAFPKHIAVRFNDVDEASRFCCLPSFLIEECERDYGIHYRRRAA
jgi:transcriptional regulator with XRE-family HTH domain